MDEICALGWILILVIIGCVAFVVLGIPLFYTLITRWLTADGAPVVDSEGMRRSAAPAPVAAAPAPVAPKAEVKPEPEVVVEAKKRDDLKVLPGVLAEMEAKLNSAGISRYSELADLSADEVKSLGDRLSFRNGATWAAWQAAAKELSRDDLKALPALLLETEAKLNSAGIRSYEQIAALSDAEVGAVGDKLSLRNRATWNAWRAKAAELAG